MQRGISQSKIYRNNCYCKRGLYKFKFRDPFVVADPKEAMLLARFIVEDNNLDVVNLDPEA